MAIEILGTGQPDGTSMVKAVTEKVHLYGGTGVVQADTIANAATFAGTDAASIVTELNTFADLFDAVLVALEGVGVVASS